MYLSLNSTQLLNTKSINLEHDQNLDRIAKVNTFVDAQFKSSIKKVKRTLLRTSYTIHLVHT